MENSEVLCLLLKEFKDNVSSAWQLLKDNRDFSDVTLACERKQIPAHRFVLAASSPVLNELLQHNTHPHPVIYLRGVKYKHLVNILEFVYRGQVNVEQDELNGFLAVARDLCIKGLTEEDNEGNDHFKEMINYEDLMKEKVKQEKDEDNMIDEYLLMKKNVSQKDSITEEVFKSKLLQNVIVEMEADLDDYSILKAEPLNERLPPVNISDQEIRKQQIEMSNENNLSDQETRKQQIAMFNENNLYEPNAKRNVTDEEDDCKKSLNIKIEENYLDTKSDKAAVQHRKILLSCEQCDYTTPKKFLLKRHILSIHKHVKLSCEQCIYKASSKSNLKKHTQKVHEGLRYPCELCDFKATLKTYLTFHIKNVHL